MCAGAGQAAGGAVSEESVRPASRGCQGGRPAVQSAPHPHHGGTQSSQPCICIMAARSPASPTPTSWWFVVISPTSALHPSMGHLRIGIIPQVDVAQVSMVCIPPCAAGCTSSHASQHARSQHVPSHRRSCSWHEACCGCAGLCEGTPPGHALHFQQPGHPGIPPNSPPARSHAPWGKPWLMGFPQAPNPIL